jgi:hypothetical protein
MQSEMRDSGEMRNESRYLSFKYRPITVIRNIFVSLKQLCTMVQWWFQFRRYDENTTAWWWNNGGMMVKSQWCDGTMVKIISRFQHNAIAVSLSYHRCFTIVQSLFHVRTIVFSPSYHRVFIIMPLCHRAFTIVPSWTGFRMFLCSHSGLVNQISWIRDIRINISTLCLRFKISYIKRHLQTYCWFHFTWRKTANLEKKSEWDKCAFLSLKKHETNALSCPLKHMRQMCFLVP